MTTSSYSFEISVEVNMVIDQHVDDVTVEEEFDAVIYIGNINVESVAVNGKTIAPAAYLVKDYTLIIDKECFEKGENTVTINGTITFKVTVLERETSESEEHGSSETDSSSDTSDSSENSKPSKSGIGCGGYVSAASSIVFITSLVGIAFFIRRKRGVK